MTLKPAQLIVSNLPKAPGFAATFFKEENTSEYFYQVIDAKTGLSVLDAAGPFKDVASALDAARMWNPTVLEE